MKSVALRLSRCLAGYLFAVIVSSQVALALILLLDVMNGVPGNGGDFISLIAIAAYFTAIFAAMPALFFIATLELSRSQRPLPHALSGAATAFLACLLVFHGSMARDPGWAFVALCMVGGAAGGLTYWWVAGRSAGHAVFLRFRRPEPAMA